MPMSPAAANRVKYSQMKLRGGLDLVTPTLDLPSGFLRDSENFEVSETGGYRRIDGYERFDGRPKPSAAIFEIVQFASFTNTPVVGTVLTDAGTAGFGTIVSVQTNYVVLTKHSGGAHTVGNNQLVGATLIGVMIAPTLTLTPILIAQYLNLAADSYRADITVPTGSGPVRGVATLVVGGVDKTFCFRDNAGGTAVNLWVASSSGWTAVTLPREVSFTTATAGPALDGQTLTQGANTATIRRVMFRSGSWTGGTVNDVGRYIISTPAPGEFAAGIATTPTSSVTLTGASTAVTLTPGGKFELFVWNFFGQASGLRLYGCDGVNRMFEFDGTYLCPITTGVTPDTPKHLGVLANHLFGAFASSVIHAAPGLPFFWQAGTGLGAEIATGDTVTGFMSLQGSQTAPSLAIYGARQSSMLYGSGTATWTLSRFDQGVGALDYSVQRMDDAYALDDPGVMKLKAVQDFGNFSATTLTQNILPLIRAKRTILANSIVNREKSQYRLFFTDTSALYLTVVNGRYMGAALQRFQHTVFSTSNSDSMRVNGDPDVFIGTTDGYVMQLDKGTSFDGQAIEAYLETNWETFGSPRVTKRLLKAALEVQGSAFVAFTLSYSLGYGSPTIKEPDGIAYALNVLARPVWDSVGVFWDLFTWDGISIDIPSEIELKGRAETMKYRISSGTDYVASYTINSLITHYEMGRGMR